MKTEKELVRIGKFFSLVLRHKPEDANIVIDTQGWTDVNILLKNIGINRQELEWILANNNKKRFSYNANKTKVRANQGHSLPYVKIDYQIVELEECPEFLFHGTSTEVLEILLKEGISKMKRNEVHLSKDNETAVNVGKRKSSNIVILKIKAKDMIKDGIDICISENGVYLTDFVPSKYLEIGEYITK
jgi:putative RNA 2'-phosphotransferase